MTTRTLTCRSATVADLAAIVAVFLDCWRDSYRDVLPVDTITAMTSARAASLWSTALTDAPTSQVIVATASGHPARSVVGVGRWEPDHAAPSSRPATVRSLYVSPTAQRAGIGTALLADLEGRVWNAGPTTARLWVFAANRRGIDFYERHGWCPDGVTRIQDEFGQPEIRLRKVLTDA
ncbi:hypothetical protein BH24ACT5_BH24ACT5_02640 [soil metagenome]